MLAINAPMNASPALSSPLSVDIPTSLLLHVSLAHARIDYVTYDSLLSSSLPLPFSTTKPKSKTYFHPHSLPYEILQQIQTELLRAIAVDLIQESKEALVAYERGVKEGLCEDCLRWNGDVYGDDVWGWPLDVIEGNSGCQCRIGQGKKDRAFESRVAWLEDYLRRSSGMGMERSAWDIVAELLGTYGCSFEVLERKERKGRCYVGMERLPVVGPSWVRIGVQERAATGGARLGSAVRELCLDGEGQEWKEMLYVFEKPAEPMQPLLRYQREEQCLAASKLNSISDQDKSTLCAHKRLHTLVARLVMILIATVWFGWRTGLPGRSSV